MRERIRRLMQYFFPTRPSDARAMRPGQRADRNRHKPTLDELESRLAPSVTIRPGSESEDFFVDIDAADNISVGVTDNAKLRVTVEGSGDLNIQHAASSIQRLTITAAGNFANTIDLSQDATADFISLVELNINAGGGNDTVLASRFTTIDNIDAGDGDDTIAILISGVTVQGGNGLDTLRFDGPEVSLDLTNPDFSSRLRGIETIDLSGTGNHILTLNAQAVLDVSGGANTLVVKLNAGDTLNKGAGWTAIGKETIGGAQFTVYTQGAATLKVNDNAQLTPPARAITAKLVKKVVGGRVLLRVRVRFADTGAIKREFNSPLQGPTYTKIKVAVMDSNADGAADLIAITGFKNGKKVTRLRIG
jgi:hypothetical protein